MSTRSLDIPRPPPAEDLAEPVGTELAGVLLVLAGLLLGSALFTLAPEGTQRGLANVVGPAGRAVAEGLTVALGAGAWVLAAFPLAWGVACLRGRAPSHMLRKALFVPVIAGLIAVLLALVARNAEIPGLSRSGPGGYVGVALAQVFWRLAGRAAALVVAGLLVACLILATDLRVAALLGKVRPARRARAPRAEGGTAVAEPGEGEDEAEGEAGEDAAERLDGLDDDAYAPTEASAEEAEHGHGGDRDLDEDGLDLAHASEEDVDAALREATEEDAAEEAAKAEALRAARPPAPEKPKSAYEFPPVTLFARGETTDVEAVRHEIDRNAALLAATLRSFGIESRVVEWKRGPVVTFYELELQAGTRISRVATLDRDLAVALKAESVRVVAPIPGKNTIGVEVPNLDRDSVRLPDIMECASEKAVRRPMPLFLGRDALGEPIVEDLAAMPHMLIAGATGSGKSVCVNSVLLSVMMTRTPEQVKFILVDPKQVELSFFEGIPHLLTPVVTNMKKAAQIFEWAVGKMEHRYEVFQRCRVRNIAGYNALPQERREQLRTEHGFDAHDAPDLMPYVVIVVDELADLMLQHGKDVENAIVRLAAKSRAVGIHLVLATQRPSVDVITGLIKSNMPMRMSFKVASKIDSRVILDHNGADKLLGKGDMLYIPPGSSVLKRAQGTFIPDAEVEAVVAFVKERSGAAEYQDILGESAAAQGDPNEEDELYDDAVRAVLTTKLGSASMLQRKFGIGYTRASRLIDMMCDHRVVGPHKGSKARELLLTLEEWEAALAARKGEELPPSMRAPADDLPDDAPMGPSDADDGILPTGSKQTPVPTPWD